ncbi:MAG: RDD family protein [Promethearchaeota archaeon]
MSSDIFCPNCGMKNSGTGKFCAACGQTLDDQWISHKNEVNFEEKPPVNTVEISGQEQSEIRRYADFGDRFIAYLIDSIIFSAIGSLLGTIFGLNMAFWGLGDNIFRDQWFNIIIGFVYFFAFEALNHGQTLGKMAMKLRTIDNRTGKAPTPDVAILHVLGKVIILGLDVIIAFFAKDHSTEEGEHRYRFTQAISHTSVIKLQ